MQSTGQEEKEKAVSQYAKMTQTPIPALIGKLSVPTIISMLVTNIYNLVDTAFVGKLGNSASGAVGVVFGYMAILQAVGFLFGQGAGSLMSRKLGSKQKEQASQVASTGFFSALFISIVIAVLTFLFLNPLVGWLGSTDTIAPFAKDYIRYIAIAAPLTVTTFTMNNLLRYEGRAMLGMVGLMSGAVLNILGDMLFMFGMHMGISGAGLSTALSQVVSFGILLSMFLRGKTVSRLSFHNFADGLHFFPDIVLTGLPSLLRQGLNSVSTVLMNQAAGVYGDPAVAAMSIVSRIGFFVGAMALGIGQGFQPVCAFNYGAGKYSRVKKAFFFAGFLGEAIIFVCSTVVILFAPKLIYLFRADMTVVELGTRAIRLLLLGQLFLPMCMVTEMMHQGTGHKLGASLMSSIRSGLFFIPLLLILSQYRGMSGIQEAQPLACVLSYLPTLLFAIAFFKRMPAEDRPEAAQTDAAAKTV